MRKKIFSLVINIRKNEANAEKRRIVLVLALFLRASFTSRILLAYLTPWD